MLIGSFTYWHHVGLPMKYQWNALTGKADQKEHILLPIYTDCFVVNYGNSSIELPMNSEHPLIYSY